MSAAAAAAVAQMNALSAAAGMVRVEPEDFLAIADRSEQPLIVHFYVANKWMQFMTPAHHYVMPYRGLTFVTKTPEPLPLPKGTELIEAKHLYLPI